MHLLIFSFLLLLALTAHRVARTSGVPVLFLFLSLGITCNFFGLNFNDFHLTDKISNIALVIIMFYGGFKTDWNSAKKVALPAFTLSTLGVVVTSVLTALFAHIVLHMELIEALLLGSVVGSTDFASVSNILSSHSLNLKHNTSELLEIESGSNDPCAYTMCTVFLAMLANKSMWAPVVVIQQFFLGALLGIGAGFIAVQYIKRLHMTEDGLCNIFIVAILIGTYALTNLLGGNGFLAVYLLGIYLGNREFVHKGEVIFFFDGVSALVEIVLFFLLGILSNPQHIIANLPIGFACFVFMTVIARPISVCGLLLPFRTTLKQNALISFAGIRGAAAIVFAIMAYNSGAPLGFDIFHIVFAICMFSLLIQGTTLPYLTKLLSMSSNQDRTLRTFNHYQLKAPFSFVSAYVDETSPLVNKTIQEITFDLDLIIAKIDRAGRTIIPKGDTRIRAHDTIVVGGETSFDHKGEKLMELRLSEEHAWVGKTIAELDAGRNTHIIMIGRKDHTVIIPSGESTLQEGDRVVILTGYHEQNV